MVTLFPLCVIPMVLACQRGSSFPSIDFPQRWKLVLQKLKLQLIECGPCFLAWSCLALCLCLTMKAPIPSGGEETRVRSLILSVSCNIPFRREKFLLTNSLGRGGGKKRVGLAWVCTGELCRCQGLKDVHVKPCVFSAHHNHVAGMLRSCFQSSGLSVSVFTLQAKP